MSPADNTGRQMQTFPDLPKSRNENMKSSADFNRSIAAYSANWRAILASPSVPFHQSILEHLGGLPYSVAYRNLGAVEGWRRAMYSTKWGQHEWQLFESESLPAMSCVGTLNAHIGQHYASMTGLEAPVPPLPGGIDCHASRLQHYVRAQAGHNHRIHSGA